MSEFLFPWSCTLCRHKFAYWRELVAHYAWCPKVPARANGGPA